MRHGERLRNAVPYLIIAALGLALSFPLIFSGFPLGDDSGYHILWAQQFARSVSFGNIFPQWVFDSNHGFGNPSFIFYPPLSFYSYLPASAFTGDVLRMINISGIAGIILSGFAMYFFLSARYSKTASVIGAALHMALPYHLIDIYKRSAMAELWAFVWVPLEFHFASFQDGDGRMRRTAMLGLCFAGHILTHLPTAMLAGFFLIAFMASESASGRGVRPFIKGAGGLSLGVCISAFYLLPALIEQKYIGIENLTGTAWFSLKNNFLFSEAAGDKKLNAQLSASATALAVVLIFAAIGRLRGLKSGRVFSFAVFAGIASFALMLRFSNPIWDSMGFLSKVQFPWRLMLLQSFFVAWTAGAVADYCLLSGQEARKRFFSAAILLALALSAIPGAAYAYRSFMKNSLSFKAADTYKSWGWRISPDLDMTGMEGAFGGMLGNQWLLDALEYRPIWAAERGIPDAPDKPGYIYDIHGEHWIFPPLSVIKKESVSSGFALKAPLGLIDRHAFIEGGEAAAESWNPEERVIKVNSGGGILFARTLYYPRWKAYAGSRELTVSPDKETGVIAVEVPEGDLEIRLVFENGIWRNAGIGISVVALIVFSGLVFSSAFSPSPRP